MPDGTAGEDIVKYYLDTANISVASADGTISGLPEYYTPDEVLSAEGYVFSGWSTEEGATAAESEVALANEDVVLYPGWKKEPLPGLNALTGDALAITFDDASVLDKITVVPKWLSSAHVTSSIQGGIYGNSLLLKNTNSSKDASGHFVILVKFKSDVVVDRPAYAVMMVKDAQNHWYLNNTKVRENLAGSHKTGVISKDTGAETTYGSDTVSIDLWTIYSNNYNAYIDNAALIPYYKITYKNVMPDGTAGEDIVKYYLDTANISVASADGTISGLPEYYTPDESLSAEGYVFSGWSTNEGATETMTQVALANKDVILYPVWESDSSPSSLDMVSLRTSLPQGIRIASFVSSSARENAVEYGYITARADSLSAADYTDLTFTSDVNMIKTTAYEKGSKDVIYIDARESTDAAKAVFGDKAFDEYGVYFTGVYTGIPETAAAYKTSLVSRPYVKVGDRYFYGKPMVNCVYDTALVLKAKYDAEGKAIPEYVTKVIEITEAAE
ncbi:MAG: InlB B-repeat-containing protein, partial [Clostridia bacterium]|nr:InlB B-repeat-containing protein [Clostridia bacterium]